MAKENEMFVGFIIFAIVSTAVGIMVTIPQRIYEVARGDNVTLPCTFKPAKPVSPDNPIVVVSWSFLSDKPGVKGTPVATYYHSAKLLDIAPAYEGKVSMKRDMAGGAVDLYLTRVTLKENKVFECEVKIPNDDAGTLAATTRLVVLVAPSPPVCKIQGTSEYGQNVNLTCISEEGSPVPTYSWKRNNVQNQPSPFPPRATDKNGHLSLFNLSMETSGYYLCTSVNKIRSATCNVTLTVLPPSMNIGSTAGIIGGCVAALLVVGIIVYCCCCRKKAQPEEYAMGAKEEEEYHDKEPLENEGGYRDDEGDVRSKKMDQQRGRVEDPQDQYEERSERKYDRRDDYDERSERNYDRRDNYDEPSERNSDRRDDYDERSERNSDRRDDYDDRRERYDDRRDGYDDRREQYSDSRERQDDRRDN